MKIARTALGGLMLLCSASQAIASGSIGIYAIVEKVVFEPSEQAPERIQVWGSFAFLEKQTQTVSVAKRGYMYFRLNRSSKQDADNAKTEWMDLKSIAGTGQAVAFGLWGYIGAFEGLQADGRAARSGPPYALARDAGNSETDVRVRPESEKPQEPAVYSTNAGIVKLSAEGSHADIVKKLKESLKR